MNQKLIASGALLGALAIILGAFGAHALKKILTVEELSTFETGVKYQMYHALFLLIIGSNTLLNERTKRTIFYLVLIGINFFSGSIYLLAINRLTSYDFKIIGFLTPIGGFLLIAAWIVLFLNISKKKA